jgi:hypothetical protein
MSCYAGFVPAASAHILQADQQVIATTLKGRAAPARSKLGSAVQDQYFSVSFFEKSIVDR